jgi:aspartyl-tRNA(Asn)/glutamyl-tRNA(Gln) amidotransferase subunit B
MFAQGESAHSILKKKNLCQISDNAALEKLAEEVLARSPGPTEDYLRGKKKALGFLMGAAMEASQGRANPVVLKEILAQKITAQPKKY